MNYLYKSTKYLPSYQRYKKMALSLMDNPYKKHTQKELDDALQKAKLWIETHELTKEERRRFELLECEIEKRSAKKVVTEIESNLF